MEISNYHLILPRSGREYQVGIENSVIKIKGINETILALNTDHRYSLEATEEEMAILTEAIFAHQKNVSEISINNQNIKREAFYQNPQLWLTEKPFEATESWTDTNGVSHPMRPNHYHGIHYSRYIPSMKKILRFRTIKESDLETFHQWHNQQRVAFFWELAQSKEELKKYIEDGLNKKHQIPMIVEADGEAVGYFEFYWVREDRLGPYYESRPYDRGFHFLIGNKRYLGKSNTDAITHSALHFIYLDNVKTEFTMAEPRYDNNKVLKYADDTIGWKALKIFDFPHKRAVLLENSRELFFKGARL